MNTLLRIALPVLLLCIAFLVTPTRLPAHDATPATPSGFGIQISEGTCTDISTQPSHRLGTVAAVAPTSAAEPDPLSPLQIRTATVDDPLADLTHRPHTIMVRDGIGQSDIGIVCGDFGRGSFNPADADSFAVGLHQVNGSDFAGIAVFRASGDQTTVTVYLAAELARPLTPATPAHAADIVRIDIRDLAYDPPAVIISAGQRVSWTNNDPVAHTVVANDPDTFPPGTLQPGETIIRTFDRLGIFEYFCEFHGTMHGVIVVV